MGILYHTKISFTHISYTHNSAGQAHFLKLLFGFFFIILFDINRITIYRK